MDTSEALGQVRHAIQLALDERKDGSTFPVPLLMRYERLGELERRLLDHVGHGEEAPPELLAQVEALLHT